MIQEYVPYWEWEDWISGMWRKLPTGEEAEWVSRAIEFTGDWRKYGAAMRAVSIAWPNTMRNSLTNMAINPRAFIGHCACCYSFGCPEYITRIAWHRLSEQQRFDADKVAQKTVDEWRRNAQKNSRLHSVMGAKVLRRGVAGRSPTRNIGQSTVIQENMFGYFEE